MSDGEVVPQFFGEPWPSGICTESTRGDTPVGEPCMLCGELIVDGDQGQMVPAVDADGWRPRPQHRECALRAVFGGIGHLRDHVHWCNTVGDPDGGLSYRDSALAVWAQLHPVG